MVSRGLGANYMAEHIADDTLCAGTSMCSAIHTMPRGDVCLQGRVDRCASQDCWLLRSGFSSPTWGMDTSTLSAVAAAEAGAAMERLRESIGLPPVPAHQGRGGNISAPSQLAELVGHLFGKIMNGLYG